MDKSFDGVRTEPVAVYYSGGRGYSLSPSCFSYATQNAMRGVPIGFAISGIQSAMNSYSSGFQPSLIFASSIRAGTIGAYEWGVFVWAAAMTRCTLMRVRGGQNDVINAAAAGAVGGAVSVFAGVESVSNTYQTRGSCWSNPGFRSFMFASAKQNAMMASVFISVLHLVTGIL